MKKLIILSLVSVFGLVSLTLVGSQTVHAQDENIQNNLCSGANLTLADNPNGHRCDRGQDGTNGQTKLNNVITSIVNILSVIVGIVAVIMIIIGGFRYITSGGDSGNLTTAKNTIIYALVGLIVVALAQFLVKFVLAKISK